MPVSRVGFSGALRGRFFFLGARAAGMRTKLIVNHDFSGGMSTANARKDSALVLDTARQFGVPLFATAAAHSVYELAVREGLAGQDYASIGTLWEKWLGFVFGGSDSEEAT